MVCSVRTSCKPGRAFVDAAFALDKVPQRLIQTLRLFWPTIICEPFHQEYSVTLLISR